jgi:hypothetical protein
MNLGDIASVEGVIAALELSDNATERQQVAALRALLVEAQAPRAPERRFNPTLCPQCGAALAVVKREVKRHTRQGPCVATQSLRACLTCRAVVTMKQADKWLPPLPDKP